MMSNKSVLFSFLFRLRLNVCVLLRIGVNKNTAFLHFIHLRAILHSIHSMLYKLYRVGDEEPQNSSGALLAFGFKTFSITQ